MEPSPAQRFRDILADLGRIPDPAERAVEAHELQEAAKASAAHLRAILGGSVTELRNRMSLAQIATGKYGAARPRPSLIYAFRVLGNQLGRWHGEPGALPEGSYQSGRIDFNLGPNPSPYAGMTLEMRYGPVPDDGLPAYVQGYTTVNGIRMRATAAVQGELFREPGLTPRPARR